MLRLAAILFRLIAPGNRKSRMNTGVRSEMCKGCVEKGEMGEERKIQWRNPKRVDLLITGGNFHFSICYGFDRL